MDTITLICRSTTCLCKHQYLLQFSLDIQDKHIYRLPNSWCLQENWYNTNIMINNNRINEKLHCYSSLSVRPFVCPCVYANIYIFTFSNQFQQILYIMTSYVENKPRKLLAWPSEDINISYIFHWIFKINTFTDFPNLGTYTKIDTVPILW